MWYRSTENAMLAVLPKGMLTDHSIVSHLTRSWYCGNAVELYWEVPGSYLRSGQRLF